jgi:hypothetical protein
MVPARQGGMLAPPCMDHRMTVAAASTLGIRLCWDTSVDARQPNPREAWGRTLQFRQRTQADDPGLRRSGRKMPQDAGSAGPTMGGIIFYSVCSVL